jgi:hypothetical protein
MDWFNMDKSLAQQSEIKSQHINCST